MLSLSDYACTKKRLLAAHRGASGNAPENTIEAFKKAIEIGVDMVEVDIQFTLDHKIVAFHDFFPNGFNKKISELSYSELAAYNFEHEFGSNYKNEKIPLLEEVLGIITENCYVMIEVKSLTGSNFINNSEHLLQIVKSFNYLDKTLFGSFDYNGLIHLKTIEPQCHTAAIKIPGDERAPSEIKKLTNCDAFICSIDELNTEMINSARENNIFIGAYGVDSTDDYKHAESFDIDAIATNYPELISGLMKVGKKE